MERVGIYNRCSTEEESQRNALARQAAESREIAEKKGWVIVRQYIESETGTVAYKRSEYQRLLGDMEKGEFDIVMIKSIDRLMRSARDWYLFLGRLSENGLRLYIYIEGKFYTPEDNLITGIKAILAEDFSRELSKKIKNAHRRRQEKKSGCNITCEMFGWDKKGRDSYEVNQEEAAYYRLAFGLAREGKGFYTISKRLYEMGARGKSGGKISEVQWRKMLYTPRAHGTVVLNQRVYNFDTKKYEQVPEDQWIVVENALPPIVSKEYQEEVIKILRKRAAHPGTFPQQAQGGGRKYELTGKLACARCGGLYYRVGGKGNKEAFWKCSSYLAAGRKRGEENPSGCDNIHLAEGELLAVLEEALVGQAHLVWEEESWLSDIREALEGTLRVRDSHKERQKLEKEYGKLLLKKDTLVDKLLSGVISDGDFARYHEDVDAKLKEAERKINSIKSQGTQYNSYKMRIQGIMDQIQKGKLLHRALQGVLLKSVGHIRVQKDGMLEILPGEHKPGNYCFGYGKDKPVPLGQGQEREIGGQVEAAPKTPGGGITAWYVPISGTCKRREAHKREILALFSGRPGLKLKDLPQIMGMGPSYINARIKELKEEGRLSYNSSGGSSKWQVKD